MAIMAMDMAHKRNSYIFVALISYFSSSVMAGEWQFTPIVSLNETYTDNVELINDNKSTSYVSQLSASLNTKFESRMANLSLSGSSTYATYSHDHDLDDDFRTLNANGQIFLWTNGPAITFGANIANVSQNNAGNSLADLVSNDTVEQKSYNSGLKYNISNGDFSLNSAINYSVSRSDDDIGESNGYSLVLTTENGHNARYLFWQLLAQHSDRDNNRNTSKNYNYDIKIGVISSLKLNPFIRYYDEDSSGNISSNRNTAMRSWGPGINWQASKHLSIDLSYNYVDDKEKSDDYIATTINWQPSSRTSLTAGYSKRFFGDSYDLNFRNKSKRLTNSISYKETIEAFDRNSYQSEFIGQYWCPSNIDTTDLNQCFLANNDQVNLEDFQLTPIFNQELLEGNEFSINNNLSLNSSLALARTTFTVNITNNERESLSTNQVDNRLTASLAVSRKVSGKSNIKLDLSFNHNEFNKDNIEVSGQEDYYRQISLAYERKLAKSLSSDFSIKHLNRSSTNSLRSYEEIRAVIQLTKDF